MADLGTVARPYARALYEIAAASGELGSWSDALAAAAAVAADSAARRFLARPEVDDTARAAFIESICEAVGTGEIWRSRQGRNLLGLLAENDRLAVLPEIARAFDELKAEAEHKVRVTLTTATPVDEALVSRVGSSLEAKLGRKVELAVALDPSLIGGAVIRAEGSVIDGSVKSRLERLAEKLIA